MPSWTRCVAAASPTSTCPAPLSACGLHCRQPRPETRGRCRSTRIWLEPHARGAGPVLLLTDDQQKRPRFKARPFLTSKTNKSVKVLHILPRLPGGEQPDQSAHGHAQSPDARAPTRDHGIERDVFQLLYKDFPVASAAPPGAACTGPGETHGSRIGFPILRMRSAMRATPFSIASLEAAYEKRTCWPSPGTRVPKWMSASTATPASRSSRFLNSSESAAPIRRQASVTLGQT